MSREKEFKEQEKIEKWILEHAGKWPDWEYTDIMRNSTGWLVMFHEKVEGRAAARIVSFYMEWPTNHETAESIKRVLG